MSRVDIIIPAYNPGEYIHDALRSAFGQSFDDIGVIVVDDCSDNSLESLASLYPGIKYYRTSKNSGVSAARNLAITNSSAEFISLLDADDIMHRDKIKESLSVLDSQKNIGMTCGNYRVIYNRKKLCRPFYSKNINITYPLLMRQNFVASGSTTIRRSVLDDVGAFDESLWISEDYDMWLRISEKYKIKYINKVLYYYSVIPDSESLTNRFDSKSAGEKNSSLIRGRSRDRVRGILP